MMYHPFSIECTLVRLYIVRVDHKKLFKILTLDILYTGMPEKGETQWRRPLLAFILTFNTFCNCKPCF